jgi:hypothetical protein
MEINRVGSLTSFTTWPSHLTDAADPVAGGAGARGHAALGGALGRGVAGPVLGGRPSARGVGESAM